MKRRDAAAGIFVLALGTAGAGAVGASPAISAEDTTQPTLQVPLRASFDVGRQIDVGEPIYCDDSPAAGDIWVYHVPLKFSWSGEDDGGAVRYSLDYLEMASGGGPVFADSTQTSYSTADGSNFRNDCGGPNYSVYEWYLTATDAAGNATTETLWGGRVRLTQDDGTADRSNYASKPRITYTGAWDTSRCSCWSGGTVRKTSARGAKATVVPRAIDHYSGTTNHHVGLVMEKGPNRGKFQVYVDGRLKRTVDLYAPTSQPRTIVWQRAFRSYGHTIEIVNLATAGRPRIDVDAVVTN